MDEKLCMKLREFFYGQIAPGIHGIDSADDAIFSRLIAHAQIASGRNEEWCQVPTGDLRKLLIAYVSAHLKNFTKGESNAESCRKTEAREI
jgi:hypothetical protein